jgi:hypothetical protein
MTTTQTDQFPNVTPPPGASFVDEWQSGPPPHRVVLGAAYIVGDIEVQTSVVQFADGTIDRVGLVEPPKVHMRANREGGLTVKQALELASVLFEAAVERVGAMSPVEVQLPTVDL